MKREITTVVVSEYQLIDQDAWLSLWDISERCAIGPDEVEDLVDLGVVAPRAGARREPRQWRFSSDELLRVRRARRLRRELDLDWQGVAVAMDLLDEIHRLRRKVESLQKQLGRL